MTAQDIPHRARNVPGATKKWQELPACPLNATVRMSTSLQAKFPAFQGSMLTPEASVGLASCEIRWPAMGTYPMPATDNPDRLAMQLLGQPVPQGGFCCAVAESTHMTWKL